MVCVGVYVWLMCVGDVCVGWYMCGCRCVYILCGKCVDVYGGVGVRVCGCAGCGSVGVFGGVYVWCVGMCMCGWGVCVVGVYVWLVCMCGCSCVYMGV